VRFRLTYIFLIFCLFTKSQNYINVTTDYITNPSFEDYTACPLGNSFPTQQWIDSCKGWTTPTYATSDYFNACNSNGLNDVPNNTLAYYQPSFHGNGYCGFLAYSISPNQMWSEYLQTKLKQKLVANEIYNFTMRINRANGFNFSVKNIGAHFSKDSLRDKTTTRPFNFTPTVLNSTGFLNDTLDWTLVSGTFKANGNEEYLTIGWYGDTITSDYTWFTPPDTVPVTGELLYLTETYYLVDSLTLSVKNKKNISNFDVNVFTPNNDGVNDVIDFSTYNLSSLSFNIYNRWGILVFKSNDINLKWNGLNNNNSKLNEGVYFYILSAEMPDIKDKVQKQGYISIFN
jgi:gliding motility-associated-like protein